MPSPKPQPASQQSLPTPTVARGGFVSHCDLDGREEIVEVAGMPFLTVSGDWAHFDPQPLSGKPRPLPEGVFELRHGDVLRVPIDIDGIRGHVLFCIDDLGIPLVALKRLQSNLRDVNDPIEGIAPIHQLLHAPRPDQDTGRDHPVTGALKP